jgi:N-acetylglucosaminyldiphosphoundecaprenol N-acetyl-beta-D-mannosaminyltransferase
MKSKGWRKQERVAGMDLLPAICDRVAREGISIYLLGATEEVLAKLQEKLRASTPGLDISGAHAPPFRPLSELEDRNLVEQINTSGAGMLLIALGCPKQEEWMWNHRKRVLPLMIGLGAAFGVHAGMQRRAPLAMQRSGFEWLFRLAQEPKRLWRRYLVTNSYFCWYLLCDSIAALRGRGTSGKAAVSGLAPQDEEKK